MASMGYAYTQIIDRLTVVLRDLGTAGGRMSPSVYDTAQVVRLMPPESDSLRARDWLLRQQQADGGWGVAAVPLVREVSTLAAILALHVLDTRAHARAAVQRGLRFLRQQETQLQEPLPDDLPVGAELLFPRLLADAAEVGLALAPEPYAPLIRLGQRRRALIARMRHLAGTSAAHSWEAWGLDPSPELLDGAGGIGHSPAATAAWLQATAGRAELANERAAALRYLAAASQATGLDIEGVVPTAWPIPLCERAFGLYALLLAGRLDDPALQTYIRPHLADLASAIVPAGVGMSPFFQPDGDDTATALAVLLGAGTATDPSVIDLFLDDDHFCTWQREMQPSLSVTAHAIHALAVLGRPAPARVVAYLVRRQYADGRWAGDKWNVSWVYTTGQVLIALRHADAATAIAKGVEALLIGQQSDGGWGMGRSTVEETAYAVLALRELHAMSPGERLDQALRRADDYLLQRYATWDADAPACWLGKDLYSPVRVSELFVLAALIGSKYDIGPGGMIRERLRGGDA